MGRSILLWLLGVPIPIIILRALMHRQRNGHYFVPVGRFPTHAEELATIKALGEMASYRTGWPIYRLRRSLKHVLGHVMGGQDRPFRRLESLVFELGATMDNRRRNSRPRRSAPKPTKAPEQRDQRFLPIANERLIMRPDMRPSIGY